MLTYEQLLAECEMHGFKLVPKQEAPKTHNFSATARFERGLGPEYVNLKPVVAVSINEAQKQANELAAAYFRDNPGYEGAIINEVRIRPHD